MNRAAGFIAFKALGFSGLRVQGKLCITVKNSNTALFSGGLLSSIIVVDSTDKPCSFSCVGRAASNRALGIASSLDQVYGFSGLGSSGVCVHVFAPLNQKHSAPTNFPRISMPCASSLQFWGVQLCGMRLHKMFLCVCVCLSRSVAELGRCRTFMPRCKPWGSWGWIPRKIIKPRSLHRRITKEARTATAPSSRNLLPGSVLDRMFHGV